MVWFQCEDCGDNLKKPKLPNHFRSCSASKLSCIDCGQTFGRKDVEGHTQCITESEKYGPKGQGNDRNGSNAKPNKSSSQKPDVDINVGLSERPPWFCSLCHTQATSKQALLLHADGKKHRAKSRAFHAANQQPKESDGTITRVSTANNEQIDNKLENTGNLGKSSAENGDAKSSKKRKIDSAEYEGLNKKSGVDTTGGLGLGEVIHVPETEAKNHVKKSNNAAAENDKGREPFPEKEKSKDIRWKKLIKSTLKSNPDGALKFKKLKKLVVKSLKESSLDENRVTEVLEQKINASSKFVMEGKYVRLVSKN